MAEEPVTIHCAEIGFWIGESALLAHEPRAVTSTRRCRAGCSSSPATRYARCWPRPEDWRAFYLLSHINAVTAVNLLAQTLALSVPARVARRLLRRADPSGVVSVTRDDLAKLIGVARATLQRAFEELAQAGVIETGYRSVTIADRAALERYVNQQ